MARDQIIYPLMLALLLLGCDKKNKAPDSIWIVNGERFSSKVDKTIEKAKCGLYTNDMSNRFTLSFNIGYGLPQEGTFDLNTFEPGQHFCGINFYYHGKFYYYTPSSIGKLYASSLNGKAHYSLPVSWFVNYDSPTTDSVQISGEFYEP